MLTAWTTRWIAALLVASWSILTCCCPSHAQPAPAAQGQPVAPAAEDPHACCTDEADDTTPATQDSAPPSDHHNCACDQQHQLASQERHTVPVMQPTHLVALLDWTPAALQILPDLAPNRPVAIAESPPAPAAQSLYAQHCLLTI